MFCKGNKTKILSLLLSLVMVVALAPVTVLAAGDAPILQSAAVTTDGNVELTFNKAMADTGGGAGGFTVVGDFGANKNVKAATLVETDNTKILLTLTTPVRGGEAPRLSYGLGTISAEDGGLLGEIKYFAITNALPHPVLAGAAPAAGTVGTSYEHTFAASGGTGVYSFYHLDPLPAGLTLNSSTGVLSGTPTNAQTYPVRIRVIDINSAHDIKTFTIAINPAVTAPSAPDARIAAGGGHSLYLKEDGTVWAWGGNAQGQLGRGTFDYTYETPKQVIGLAGVKSIAAGHLFSLALKNDGTVWAWGTNGNGQLGRLPAEMSRNHTPVQITGLSGITAISAGYNFCLALETNGDVWAWGGNGKGQLGQPATETISTPAKIAALQDIVAISAGYHNALALRSDGKCWSWGSNYYGELGNGTVDALSANPTPVQITVPDGIEISGICAGHQNAMLFTKTGDVYGWGYNSLGSLGDGTITNRSVPTLTLYSDITGLGGTGAFYVARENDGTVWASGKNDFGSIVIDYSENPVRVIGLENIIYVSKSVGGNHTLALDADGDVWAWGSNTSEQCGVNTVTGEPKKIDPPVKVLFPSATLSSATITITPPAAGEIPQTAEQAQDVTNHSDYTITGLNWNEAMTSEGKFKAGQAYTATVTLTSKNGKAFQSASFTPTVGGSASVGTTTTTGSETGNTVTFTVTYGATASAPLIIITVAGNGEIGYSGDGGLATEATMDRPYGVAVDSAGNLYIADEDRHCIRMVSSSNQTKFGIAMTAGRIYTIAGTGSAGYFGDGGEARSASLNQPRGIAVDSDGNLYIADAKNGRIRMVSASDQTKFGVTMTAGNIYTIAGKGWDTYSGNEGPAINATLLDPSDIALDSHGNLYIADTQNYRIHKVNGTGIITTIVGAAISGNSGDGAPAADAKLNLPYGVETDSDGNLYIADTVNNRVRMVSASNQTRFGITMTAGNIYNIAGKALTANEGYEGDGAPAIAAKLNRPRDIAMVDGSLYIADSGNNVIRKVDAGGIITTVAGTGMTPGYSGDGDPASQALLYNPFSLSANRDGDLFISDTGNYVIRKIFTGTPATAYLLTVENGTGGGSYAAGIPVSITANPPAQGKIFDKWITSNGGSFDNAASASTTFIMPSGAVTVTATYKDAPVESYALTVNGSYAEASGAGQYAPGVQVSIHAGSRSNYSFTGWTASDGVTFANAGSATTTFTMPYKAVAVTANWIYSGGGGGSYTPNTYSIIAISNEGGTITPAGTTNIVKNGCKTYTITPQAGYKIADVLVDGVSVGVVATYTFSSVTTNHKIEAKFAHDCPSAPFTDVDITQWYHEGIDYVLLTGLFKGTSATTFEPNAPMTRAMLVTVLHRVEGAPTAITENPFADVASGKWYTNAVVWASAKGIVKGYDAETFGPEDLITREQMATILYRYAENKGYDVSVGENTNILSFEDALNISEYAIPAIQWACGAGIVQGNGGKLDPQGNATRAQVAAMLMRFIENVAK